MFWNTSGYPIRIRSRALAILLTTALLILGADFARSDVAEMAESVQDSACVSLVETPMPEARPDSAGKVGTDLTLFSEPPDSIIAYYFHRTLRCETCIKMEACILDVIKHDCFEALKDGTVRWRPLDYEQPENSEYVETYGLGGPALVLSHWVDGREVLCARVDEIWSFIDDPEAVSDRLRQQFEECLTGKCRHDEFFAPDTSYAPIPSGDTLRSEERQVPAHEQK